MPFDIQEIYAEIEKTNRRVTKVEETIDRLRHVMQKSLINLFSVLFERREENSTEIK